MLYGSSMEMALRILLLLFADRDESYSLNRIIYYDFIVTYGRYFGVSEENLHGENDYGFGELARRRKYATLAIKELVIRRLVEVHESEKGFYYQISEEGLMSAKSLSTEYAKAYRLYADVVTFRYKNFTDHKVMQSIDASSKMMLRGGEV